MKIRVMNSPLVAGFVRRNGCENVSPSTTNSISTGVLAPIVLPRIVKPSCGESVRSMCTASLVVELMRVLSRMWKSSALPEFRSRLMPSTPTPPASRFSVIAPCPISLPASATIDNPAKSESSTVRPATSVFVKDTDAPTPSPKTRVSSIAIVSSPVTFVS